MIVVIPVIMEYRCGAKKRRHCWKDNKNTVAKRVNVENTGEGYKCLHEVKIIIIIIIIMVVVVLVTIIMKIV